MASELSILIPIYNFNICPLVNNLLVQCRAAAICFEIICLDDASDETYKVINRSVANLPNVVYQELPLNISRAAIRNKLGFLAQYAYLLFIDNDSEIISPEYILNYLRNAQPDLVLIGGTTYQPNQPARKYRLHWQVGRHREQKSAEKRKKQPYKFVHVNNALVPKSLFLKYTFNEEIFEYGHEDTCWAYRLQQSQIRTGHLNNPVRHIGLESTEVFLIKAKQAVANLYQLFTNNKTNLESPVLRIFLGIKKLRLIFLAFISYKCIKPFILLNLRSAHPFLICFDLYKLGEFISINRMKQNNN